MKRRWKFALGFGLLLTAYVGSYVVFSRLGLQRAACDGSEFYCFVEPTSPVWEQVHYRLTEFYYPLIQLELWLRADYAPSACEGIRLS